MDHEEKLSRKCKTCEFYEYDNWYPDERVCACPESGAYGDNTDPDDQCESWEERQE